MVEYDIAYPIIMNAAINLLPHSIVMVIKPKDPIPLSQQINALQIVDR